MLALIPGASWALGLGKPSTRAVLGETLRLTVPLRLEPGEQVADDCVSAEVYFGDDKLAGTVVSAQVVPVSGSAAEAARGGARTLLIRTTALINEPVVTVYLSAGCQARITRKFVALADPPSDMTPLAPAAEQGLSQAVAEVTESDRTVAAPAMSSVARPRAKQSRHPSPHPRRRPSVACRWTLSRPMRWYRPNCAPAWAWTLHKLQAPKAMAPSCKPAAMPPPPCGAP